MWAALKEYFSEFKILKKTPREFWIMNLVINFFEMLAYFAFITVLSSFLSTNLGISDYWAGVIVGVFTLILSIIVFCAGFIIDSIGIKRALFISMIMLVPCRLLFGSMDYFEDLGIEARLVVGSVATDARKEITDGHYNETVFTREQHSFKSAQADLVGANLANIPEKPDPEKLKADAKTLHDAALSMGQYAPPVFEMEYATLAKRAVTLDQSAALLGALLADAKTAPAKAKEPFDALLKEAKEELAKTLPPLPPQKAALKDLDPVLEVAKNDPVLRSLYGAGLYERAKKPSDGARIVFTMLERYSERFPHYYFALQGIKIEWLKAQTLEHPLVAAGPTKNIKAVNKTFLDAAKGAPEVRSELVNDIGFRNQKPEEFRDLMTRWIGLFPELKEKYTVKIDTLEGSALRSAMTPIIKAFPALRDHYSPQMAIWIAICTLLFFMAIGEALMSPAIYIALRRYTNRRTSGSGFNFQYLTMNIGAVVSFVMYDALRETFGIHQGNAAIILIGSLFGLVCVVGVMMLRGNIEVAEDEECTVQERPVQKKEDQEAPWTIAMAVFKEPAFWRFMFFLVLLIGVKLVFTHQFLVMPKYYERVLGVYSQVGLLNTINPIIITIGLILMIPILGRFRVFDLIVVGTTISAISVFTLLIPGKWFQTNFGISIELGYLIVILAQIIIFAIGEMTWSPRLSEYTVTIAPKGREGAYMGLAALPMFLAKPLNGLLSGYLLENYCPEDVMDGIVAGTVNFWNGPEMMWLILGLISISSPILVVVFRKVIENPADKVAPNAHS